MTQVVHVLNDRADGRAVTRAQNAMRRLHERGYAVCPVPADGRQHRVYDPAIPGGAVTCPACTKPNGEREQ